MPAVLASQSPASDAALATAFGYRVRSGDTSAFAELYTALAAPLHRYIVRILRNRDDAADVGQQAFTQAFEARRTYDPSLQSVEVWMYSIARNCAIDHRRRHARTQLRAPAELDDYRDAPAAPAGGRALARSADHDLHVPIERLNVLQKEVLVLHYLHNLTYGDIGLIVGRSEDAVSHIHHRALRRLRQLTAVPNGYGAARAA